VVAITIPAYFQSIPQRPAVVEEVEVIGIVVAQHGRSPVPARGPPDTTRQRSTSGVCATIPGTQETWLGANSEFSHDAPAVLTSLVEGTEQFSDVAAAISRGWTATDRLR
jgi:hypothetical protein